MKINIGFIHKKESLSVTFRGVYDVYSNRGEKSGQIDSRDKMTVELLESSRAECEWYEKLETVYDIEKLESVRKKYYLSEVPTRVVKSGREIGSRDNFEYWILGKTSDMEGKIYPSGDYRYKKIVKREASGTIRFGKDIYQNSIKFVPRDTDCTFTVDGVDVGIGFHWDHSESLEYSGSLEVIVDTSGKLTGINIVDLEEYLASVNSSEMRNDNNIEMLKAQTVAARSTVLATMGKHHFGEGFDLCSDDHCQCYQGLGKISKFSRMVTEATAGEVLLFDGTFADARYSKICGGITERYSTCWEDMDFPYLAAFSDSDPGREFTEPLSEEGTAHLVSDKDHDCFCNTFLNRLPESLEFCKDLFRWEQKISCAEIQKNLNEKFGTDIGKIESIEALKRGYSGRIFELGVKGTKGGTVISKELNIRRLLSKTHLPSSAFIINGNANGFELKGAGWGHGVGLCQIGAQIMGEKGYGYQEILKHYYRGAAVRKAD